MATVKKYLDATGLGLVWAKIKLALADKVDKVDGKGLSSNDYTSAEKTKLANVASGAQVNVLEGIQKNGQNVSITNKIANISVPTKTSDITNDSGFITTADIPEGAAASTTTPLMDGTAAVGTELAFARGDHRHPSDTSKVDKVDGKGLSENDFTTTLKNKLDGIANGANKTIVDTSISSTSTNPVQNSVIATALGSKADKSSPTFTGTPKAPTAAAGTSTTQIATTEFVANAVTTAIGALEGVSFSIVNSLPATGDSSVIYLVSASGGGGSDVYDEYIWLSTETKFEKIGRTDIDLSDYYNTSTLTAMTSAEIDAACS